MKPPITSKSQFARLYRQGVFGNASPTFDTLDECLAFSRFGTAGYQLWHIRNRVAGGPTFYNVPWTELSRKWRQLTNPKQWYISCMAPTACTLLQGEIIRGPLSVTSNPGLHFLYTTVPRPMREALAEKSREISGIIVNALLDYFMPSRDREWLEHLMEKYPGHVIEFSVYDHCWGTVEGYQTVYWECRAY